MDNRQNAKKNMFAAMMVFFANTNNSSIWQHFQKLVDKITAFIGAYGELEKFIQQQSLPTAGTTASKNEKVQTMIKSAVGLSRKARVWAQDAGETEMETLFDVHDDDFAGEQDAAVALARDIYDALSGNRLGVATVNITDDDIDDFHAAIDAADGSSGEVTDATSQTVAGTEGIDSKMHEIDGLLVDIDDLLVPEYEESDTNMVNAYHQNRKTATVGVHHTGIRAFFTFDNDNENAEGINVSIRGLNKSAVSDINGKAEIIKMKSGTYHVDITGNAIEDKSIIVTIRRGDIVELHVQVRRKAQQGG